MNITLHDKEFQPFISAEEIEKRVKEIGKQISQDFKNDQPIFLGILNGCILFFSDLIKNVSIDCSVSFVRLTSYEGTDTTGTVKTLMGFNEDISGKSVIVVEDIVDTGLTLEKIVKELIKKGPKDVKIASLLFKPKVYQKEIPIDYIGFEIPPNFVVGYGLDYDGLGRNLNQIYTLVK